MTPDLILFNADVRSMDPARPRAGAVACAGGRIVALGDSGALRAMAGRGTVEINAGGRLLLPGFQDAHIHLLSGGTDLATAAQLYEARGITDLQGALAEHAARARNLPIVLGSGWQPGLFGDRNLTRAAIDAVVDDRPTMLFDSSAHNACLNSAAMAMVGLDRNTPDPANGHFVRDDRGEPTGMLHEEAVPWAQARLPALTDAHQVLGVRAGQVHANAHGITGIIDPRVQETEARAYGSLAAEGALTLRVSGAGLVSASDSATDAVQRLVALRHDHSGPDFWVQSAKFFLDGVFENRTAALLSAYADGPGGNCPTMFSPARIREMFTALDAARFQIHVHAIGDLAARAALDGFEAALIANGRWPSLHQLAHLQLVDPDDFARLGRLGVVANIQPLWACYDPVVPDIALDMIGPARLANTYAFRRMLAAGADWCLSSDWPVSTLNPFEIIETAVTRQARLGEGPKVPLLPAEALTVEEAVLGYTVHAAAACWRGGFTGRIRPGYSADMILLDRDIFTCAPHEIGDTSVLLTLFKGREVFRNPSFCG